MAVNVELRKAVAAKIGWTGLVVYPLTGEIFGWKPGEEQGEYLRGQKVSPYELSTDACFADLVPWAKSREWLLDLRDYDHFWIATFTARPTSPVAVESPFAQGKHPGEAICRAFLKL